MIFWYLYDSSLNHRLPITTSHYRSTALCVYIKYLISIYLHGWLCVHQGSDKSILRYIWSSAITFIDTLAHFELWTAFWQLGLYQLMSCLAFKYWHICDAVCVCVTHGSNSMQFVTHCYISATTESPSQYMTPVFFKNT